MLTHACVIYLLFKMAAKEVYRKAMVIDNKATKFHKQKMKPKKSLLNKKVKLKIETKPVVFGHTSRSIIVKITKLFVLPVRRKFHREEISQPSLIEII